MLFYQRNQSDAGRAVARSKTSANNFLGPC
jgi:hypothetical protein